MFSDHVRVPLGVTRNRNPGTAPSINSRTLAGSGLRLATWAEDKGGTRLAIGTHGQLQRFHLGFTVPATPRGKVIRHETVITRIVI